MGDLALKSTIKKAAKKEIEKKKQKKKKQKKAGKSAMEKKLVRQGQPVPGKSPPQMAPNNMMAPSPQM